MGLAAELGAAVGCLTAFRHPAAAASRESLAGGLAFYPAVGLGLGAAAAAIAGGVAVGMPAAAGPAGILVLVAASGACGARGVAALSERLGASRAVGVGLAVTVVIARAAGSAFLPAPARTTALLLAPMLGAWGIVVECYGGAPPAGRGIATALVGRARFREFGWASVIALGVTLDAGEPIGLVVVLAASLTTVGARVFAYRRFGGIGADALGATRELVETAVVAALALLAA